MIENELEECIFCRIAKKVITTSLIYETENVMSFLDINPASRGHCLVIPKKHFKDIFDIPSVELKEIITL
jgi:histidine triad (HIT) family protein